MSSFYLDFATTDGVDTDGIDNTNAARAYGRKPYPRILAKVGLTGGASAGDTIVAVMVEDTEVARVQNTKTGLAPDNDDMKALNVPIPANALLRALLKDAPNTNNARMTMDTVP